MSLHATNPHSAVAAGARYQTCVAVAGVSLVVRTNDPDIAAAIRARLKAQVAPAATAAELVFEILAVGERQAHRVRRPRGPGRPVYNPPAGEVLYFEEQDQFYIDFDGRVRVLSDLRRGYTQVSVLQSEAENLWLVSHPLFTLPLLELLKRRARYSLHAAGLCVDGRALLLPGTSGAGKSTLTLALVRSDFGFMADDKVFLADEDDGLLAFAFPEDIDVTDATVSMFPELNQSEGRARLDGAAKWQVSVSIVYGTDYVPVCRPGVLVFPRVAHTTGSVLEPIGADEALLELLPNVLLTDPESSQRHLNVLGRLVEACDCYRLQTGTDLEAVPELLRSVMD